VTTAPKQAKKQVPRAHSDPYLIEECRKGSETAWAELIDKYKNLIFSIPIHYDFAEEDSADIFQAVCMDLLAEVTRLREPNALPAWLIQVTRNKCFHRKQDLRRHNVQHIDEVDPPAAAASEPENLVTQVQKEQLLREALAELSPQCRHLLKMLFFEIPARPYEEVARELKLSQGSIGFTRRSCLEKLKEKLEVLGY
jgi:RNA polymerase sigma factor (sigma-70 family)